MSKQKTKNGVTLNLNEVIELQQEFLNLLQEKDLGFATKYRISKQLDKIKIIVDAFNKNRTEIFKEYGKCIDEVRDTWTLKDSERESEGLEELKKLIEVEELFDFRFPLSDFANVKSGKLYIHLMKFIEDEANN